MNRFRTFAQFFLGLLIFTVVFAPSHTFQSAQAVPLYQPGVSASQWARYSLVYSVCTSTVLPMSCDSFNSLTASGMQSGILQVTSVSGTVVTLRLISNYGNGTGSAMGMQIDVATGMTNSSVLASTIPTTLLIAGNLNSGEHISQSATSPTINQTATESVIGSDRQVNFLNTTSTQMLGCIPGPCYGALVQSYGTAWDRITGLMLEFSFNITGVTTIGGYDNKVSQTIFAFGMVDNNVWASGTMPDFDLHATAAVTSASTPYHETSTVSIVRSGMFTTTLKLTAATSSPSLSCSISPSSLAWGGPDKSTLDCTGPAGTYTVTVTANSGYSTRQQQVAMTIPQTSSGTSTNTSNQPVILGVLMNPFVYGGIIAAALIAGLIGVFLSRRKPAVQPVPPATEAPPATPSPAQP